MSSFLALSWLVSGRLRERPVCEVGSHSNTGNIDIQSRRFEVIRLFRAVRNKLGSGTDFTNASVGDDDIDVTSRE